MPHKRVVELYQESNGIFGYRRMQLNLKRRFHFHCNKKQNNCTHGKHADNHCVTRKGVVYSIANQIPFCGVGMVYDPNPED